MYVVFVEQVIAAKRLNLDSLQGNQEFIVEVLMLSLLHHPNLVTLIGYCAEEDQRLLVYEYMPKGSLADHLFGMQMHLCYLMFTLDFHFDAPTIYTEVAYLYFLFIFLSKVQRKTSMYLIGTRGSKLLLVQHED